MALLAGGGLRLGPAWSGRGRDLGGCCSRLWIAAKPRPGSRAGTAHASGDPGGASGAGTVWPACGLGVRVRVGLRVRHCPCPCPNTQQRARGVTQHDQDCKRASGREHGTALWWTRGPENLGPDGGRQRPREAGTQPAREGVRSVPLVRGAGQVAGGRQRPSELRRERRGERESWGIMRSHDMALHGLGSADVEDEPQTQLQNQQQQQQKKKKKK
ncbi:hypothetical protein AXG93_285s1120 [Marchantia polymorpha subsp. ruderalis]|uniref:Uncharacterized protein n=1 Tax=Marchantia polymorpha subsp. ruderalis TaxID=1480154 RepID=A0A176VTK7_MARPO|nr:hypothetical protein AXG93_285s1120 [Marchantia polymorpha subsp. ruderalis]